MQRLGDFVAESFLFEEEGSGIDPDLSLFDAGIVDSTGVLEIVEFLEEELGVSVADADLTPANFETLRRLTDYVQRQLDAGA